MDGYRSLIVPVALVALAATGCMSGKSLKVESLNKAIKDAMPAQVAALAPSPKTPPATQFAAVWQTKLSQLPDPTKNGVMNQGIVGQVFLFTDKLTPAEIYGTLTVVVNDSTDRAAGQPPRKPNVWTFDPETLKRMVVNDDRFGKSVALFLPWPEEWTDVNRLYVQARYDQADSYTIYAPPATVTLDLFSTGQFQTTITSARLSAGQLSVPDPKQLMQNAKPIVPLASASVTAPMPGSPQANYAAAWPTNVAPPPPGARTLPAGPMPAAGTPVPTMGSSPAIGVPPSGASTSMPPPGEVKEFQRIVIPRK